MVRHDPPLPANIISFKTDVRMTDWDIKNYLELIYGVNVSSVQSKIFAGPLKRVRDAPGLTKAEDYKIARVKLPIGQTFEWPNLFPKLKQEQEKEELEITKKSITGPETNKSSQKVPQWFL